MRGTTRPTQGKLILVADDNDLMRKSLATLLKSLGYRVITAENGSECLRRYRENQPDLMLLDLRMPHMDGMDVLEDIRADLETFPVIIISGEGTLTDAIKTLKLGAWDYLIKPIKDTSLLEHAMIRVFERANLIAENRHYQEYLEAEIQKRIAVLHHAQKMEAIGTLAGGIAHDFNNILAIITGYTQMAIAGIDPGSQAGRDLDQVLSACNRASELVKQILTFSRQEEQEVQPVRVQFLLKESIKLLKSIFPATIEFREFIDAECRPIMADPVQVNQIIMNMATNAKQAMGDQGGILSFSLREVDHVPDEFYLQTTSLAPERFLQLSIADTGRGIDREDLQRIFEPFYTTKPIGEGTGLGLSVVHGIVKSLNGDIKVHSTRGEGSRFELIFPTVDAEMSRCTFEAVSAPGGSERILVVDDEAELVRLLDRMLRDLGYDVRPYTDSSEALREFLADPDGYDLVLTDMTMPNLTGKDLSQRILARRPDMPVVVCTGFSEIMDREEALSIGVREYVMKPVVKHELSEVIRRVLDGCSYPCRRR
ncbi:MAG: response regulator [Desulfobulbaceae bacterium]|jgi:CheY-like chemotaxis protein|nr:response regulator [Desulfobulbaceae bacterium]MDY0351548.1 response regulator [Desulfobulbaceae bacterium]